MKHTFFTLTLFLLALLSTSCGNKKVAYQNPLPMAFGDPFLLVQVRGGVPGELRRVLHHPDGPAQPQPAPLPPPAALTQITPGSRRRFPGVFSF